MAIVFEISGPIALYRKPYTTTSSVSFPIPPPTAIAGLLAGILGIKNGSHISSFSALFWSQMTGTRIAIQRLNSTAWLSTTINFLNIKEPQKNLHIRVKHQFIKNPHFRIYVQGGLEHRLKPMLEKGEFVYTPTMGTAYALADIRYLGEFDFQKQSDLKCGEEVQIASAVPLTEGIEENIDFFKTRGLLKDSFPFRLSETRAMRETIPLIYPNSPAHRIVLKKWEGLDVTRYGEDCIAWLPDW